MTNIFAECSQFLLSFSRRAKQSLVLLIDLSACIITVYIAFYLRLGEWGLIRNDINSGLFLATVISLGLALPIFFVFGFYRAIFRYSGIASFLAIVKAIVIYSFLYATFFTVIGISGIPRTVGIIQPILLLITILAIRMLARYWLGDLYQQHSNSPVLQQALIYGAGSVGRQLAQAMMNNKRVRVVGFLDDNVALQGQLINQLPIYALSQLSELIIPLKISELFLALPEENRKHRNEILRKIQDIKISIRTLPSMTELAQGKVTANDLQELDIEDLFGRESTVFDSISSNKNILGKVVLVTGAGGSIGSELCRQIFILGPAVLLLYEQNEFSLYALHQELQRRQTITGSKNNIFIPLLGSITDTRRISEVMASWSPHTVYHAAAYKHVPLVEHNVTDGIRNNVFGTLITARMAVKYGVSDFVLVSTDKAVRPTNVMGASKRLAEMILQALARERIISNTVTNFSIVRFGNVLESSGSVIPKFRQQIRNGGPITLTHPEVMRYFMTIPEAAQLIIQAGTISKGGEVFLLDMGEAVKIIDLIRRMIQLSGLTLCDEGNPNGDIKIEIIGLRPGEKLYEELLIGDNPEPTSHPRIMKANEDFLPLEELEGKLQLLQAALDINDLDQIFQILERLISGYQMSDNIVDWVYLEKNKIELG
ncbi:MAG: polysaccharide biosynthesis protein [Nitrosospira sp.]|nr:polysaccharide biosynthesis protein [Nitrosospira sp.]MBI0414945.1 polysaccharide biosynthesis protein [Nitrosospira sp.]MBI0418356.1 polysaccharide biosynthesis protein [Nitrosospira sp.]